MNRHPAAHKQESGFLLLEAMLAVAIFAIAVLALGQCMQRCLQAESFKEEDARARRMLENRMAEIEAGEEPIRDRKTEELKGAYAGMSLLTIPTEVKAKNEDGNDIIGIYDVVLEVSWTTGAGKQSKSLEFYVTPKQR